MNARPDFKALVADCRDALSSALALEQFVVDAAQTIREALLGGKTLFTCGNGGSAADASHLAAEVLIRFRGERRPYPAISLNADGAVLTAGGNDYGYEHVFARQLRGLGRAGDVLVAFSTSGKSPNVRLALQTAHEMGLRTVAFLGRDGGDCGALAQIPIVVRHDNTARIQEVHHFLLHAICEMIEPDLTNTGPASPTV